jgi:hypothetical protein
MESVMAKLTNKRLFEALDAAAEPTGIPAYISGKVRRRHLRWLPVLAIGLASGGMALMLAFVGWRERIAGNVVLMLGFAVAMLLPILGPVKPWGGPERVDEFDRATRRDAFLTGFASVSFAAVLGIWLSIALALLGNWNRESLIQVLCALTFYLLTLYSSVPTLHASWATRPVGED